MLVFKVSVSYIRLTSVPSGCYAIYASRYVSLTLLFVRSNTIQHIRDTQTPECQVDDGDSEGSDPVLGARLPLVSVIFDFIIY